MAIVKYIKGSILDAPQKYIAHGVNCQNVMGSGVAKVLFKEYPIIKRDYHDYCKNVEPNELLGKVDIVELEDQVHEKVFNCFTQEFYGYDGKKYVNYEAIYNCFNYIAKFLNTSFYPEIAIPKIGCGLAGGNWEIVSRIIDDATGDDLDVYVYYLE